MKVSELMHTDVRAVSRDATLGTVVEELADAHITGVPVVDGHNKILGVVSTTDLLEAQAERLESAEAWEDRLVEDVMSRPPLTIAGDADIREAAQRMLYAEVHRLFVEKNGELAGIISQTDLVRALATRQIAG
jgi:CBS domain-containing protein